MVVLDTHVWIWGSEGVTSRIGRRARQLIGRAETQDALRVSVVTLFELTALCTLGRLRLTIPLEQWIREALDGGGVRVAELSSAIAIDAGRISRAALADPLDRVLVATARQLDATLLSSDARILEYASSHAGVRTYDARR